MPHEDELALTIVEMVAEREGVPATELEPPLHDVVDTDALESLFATSTPGSRAAVTFTYRGYTVHVDAAGAVQVSDTDCDCDFASRKITV